MSAYRVPNAMDVPECHRGIQYHVSPFSSGNTDFGPSPMLVVQVDGVLQRLIGKHPLKHKNFKGCLS